MVATFSPFSKHFLKKRLKAGYGYNYDVTLSVANMLGDTTVLIQAIVVFIFVVSASILLFKLKAFTELHSSDREEHRKKYLFLGLCMTLIAFAALFSFTCTVPLIVSTYYEDPQSTVILTSFNLLNNVLSTLGIVLILQPIDLDDSKRPSSNNSRKSKKSNNSQKEKLSKDRAEDSVKDVEFVSLGLHN